MTLAAFKLWLATPPGRWTARILGMFALAVAIVASVLLLRAHWIGQGVAEEQLAEAARTAAAAKKVAKVEKASAAISGDVTAGLVQTRTEIQWRTRVQIQEVTKYVPVESDRTCVVNAGAVRLRDHAFAGLPGVPEPAGGPDEAPSGVALSEFVATDVAFAGVAYDWRAEVLAWRAWHARQADLWKANIKAPDSAP